MRRTTPTRFRTGEGRARTSVLSLLPLGLAAGFVGGRALRAPRSIALPPPFEAEQGELRLPFGRMATYRAGPDEGVPLLLVHSVNAAASSYEMKPLFEHYAPTRPVYALDLPGFGLSDRRDRIYTPRLMTDAIIALVEDIRARHGNFPIDAIALSLSSEFLARAATEHPTNFRSLGLVSPTGLEDKRERHGTSEATYGKPAVRDLMSFPLWERTLFDLLVSRASMRFFLEKTWGSSDIDEGLLQYGYRSAHQPGSEWAPFSFLAGFLFSRDVLTLYADLAVPVWVCHGMRGDFADYGRKRELEARPNWTFQGLRTGALPQFERLSEMTAAYDAFLGRFT